MKKKYRLKENKEIALVVQKKQRVISDSFTIYYRINTETANKYAISVGKKFGKAVERNYSKRVVREIIRPIRDLLPGVCLVIVIRAGFKNKKYAEIKEELSQLIKLIDKKITMR